MKLWERYQNNELRMLVRVKGVRIFTLLCHNLLHAHSVGDLVWHTMLAQTVEHIEVARSSFQNQGKSKYQKRREYVPASFSHKSI
jgi:hypothetical protein